MPRKSAKELETIPPGPALNVTRLRLIPPPTLRAPVRAVFEALVGAVDARHFTRSDLPLLVEYATACVLAREADEAMAREGVVVAGRASPWLVVQEKSHRAMASLSLRLRLAPQSRMNSREAERRVGPDSGRAIDWSGAHGE